MADDIVATARRALRTAPPVGNAVYLDFCEHVGQHLRTQWHLVEKANSSDVRAAEAAGLPAALVDRIRLGDRQLDWMLALADDTRTLLPNRTLCGPTQATRCGMAVRRIPKPLGVIFMIYEARPTVTIEGAVLPVATGNAVILRGGKEIGATNAALASVIADSLAAAGLPAGMVQIVEDPDRGLLRALLKRDDGIDVLIPRGGPSLVESCRRGSRIPLIASGGGVNHLYVHASADLDDAAVIALNSKLPEPTACNALEMLLVDEAVAADLVTALIRHADRQQLRCVLRVPPHLVVPASDRVTVEPLAAHDSGREFLDRVLAVQPVAGVDPAIEHIHEHGSGHTEAIAAADPLVIERFKRQVDAAAIVVNGSLRLHDGPTMGLGPELSISTARLHVRGPVSLDALLTYSWVIDGHGALRSPVS